MATTTKPRLRYFDMLKGIAIFMVVMGHVLTMCVREIDRAVLFKLIGEIHMPLFFFISGWFTMKMRDGSVVLPALLPRARQLLIPMVAVSSIWIYYFPHSGLQSPLESTWSGLWLNEWKNGYWFTLCLFEIILLYMAFSPLLKALRNPWAAVAAVAGVWAVLQALLIYVIPAEVEAAMSLRLVVQFFPVFMVGAIARRDSDAFTRAACSSPWFTAALVSGGFLLYFVCWPWEFSFGTPIVVSAARSLLHIALAVAGIAVVKPWNEHAYSDNAPRSTRRIADMWCYLGTQSLAIYLLHYFFLFPMGGLRPWLVESGLDFMPTFAVAVFWSVVIIAVTLGLNYVISRSRMLALVLTGKV